MTVVAHAQVVVNQYRHDLIVTLLGQDVVANTSRVSYAYTVTNTGSLRNGSWNFGGVGFYTTVDGDTVSATVPFDFRTRYVYTMITGEKTITHNADGTKSFGALLHGNANPGSVAFFEANASTTGTLPTIPRASSFTVTPNTVIDGGSVDINITRASTAFTHDVTWVCGSDSGTIATGVDTATSWTPPSSLLTSTNRVSVTITVATKSGSTAIGNPVSHDFVFKSPPVYPEIGVGTPFDVRLRRVVVEGGKLVPKESITYLSLTTTDTLSASGSCKIDVARGSYGTALDEAVVLADMYDGSQWLGDGLLFVLSRTETDSADLSETVSYTGMSYVDWLLSKNVVAADLEWPTTTPGDIISQYVTIAKGRGWGPLVSVSFTKDQTSEKTAWQNTDSPKVTSGTPVSQLLSGISSDVLAEYSSHFDAATGMAVLDMHNPGYGEDWSVFGADPIVNLQLAALFRVVDTAPVRKDAGDKLTRVTVSGDEGSSTRELGSSVNPIFGHLEGTASATGVTDPNRLSQLGDAILSLNRTATVERTFSYDLSSTQTPSQLLPYRTFRPGDWILIPGDNGPERARVSQVAITVSADGTQATITTGDLIPSGLTATARKIAQAGGGAIPGGTLRAPLTLSSAIPSAPVIITVVSTGYWDQTGAPKSGVDVTWAPVTTSMQGTSLLIDLYEVWTRPGEGVPYTLAVLSDTATANIAPLEVLQSLDIKVRGRSSDGIYGAFSDPETITTLEPDADLDGPIITDLYTDGVGSIYVVWAGVLGTDPYPARMAYVTGEISTDGGTTYTSVGTPISSAGTIIINPHAWGDFLVRLRPYDRLGNPGLASDPQSITLTEPRIIPIIPVAPTDLVAVPGAAWDASGFLPEAWFDLTCTAPTVDINGDPVTPVGYDFYGLRDTETVERFITSAPTNSVRIPAGNGETWTFRVSAVSSSGGVSELSNVATATANAPVPTASAPTAPTLDQYAGLLRIKWAGGGMVPQIKYVYATISNTLTGIYTRAGMPLNGAGEIVVPGLAPDTYYAKIVMVDELGNISASVASDPITLLPITGVTIQTSPLANTGIKLTSSSLTSYDASGNPTFILNAATGEVWIAPYDSVFDLGAAGTVATTGAPTTGIAISSDNSSFNTFIHPAGLQIRNDQTALSWWEADVADASLVNFFSPRAVIGQRLRIGDYEQLQEAKTVGTRLVVRYKGV